MHTQSRIQAHIVASRKEQLRWFLHLCGETVLSSTSGEFFAHKRAFLKNNTENNEALLQLLVFGFHQYPFLARVIEPFPPAYSWNELLGNARHEALRLFDEQKFHSFLWKTLYFFKPYLSTIFGYIPKPFAFLFDPKGLGGNLPGILFQETIEIPQKKDLFWCASPIPFFRHEIAREARALLRCWSEAKSKKLWVYVHFQSLCHSFEKARGERLLALAQEFPVHLKVLHITLDAPLYMSAPTQSGIDELFDSVVKELQKKDSLYRTSLDESEKEEWLQHALNVAENAKEWVQGIQGKEASRAFMEIFSLGLARRWLGFSLACSDNVDEVFLTQGCKECVDRGAVWLFENALALSDCSLRQLQALLWGRSLLARGRLPEAYRTRGCQALFSFASKQSISSFLHDQFEKGLQKSIQRWSLTLLERR